MDTFLDYCRAREIDDIIEENNLFYHKDYMRALSSRPLMSSGSGKSGLALFMRRLSDNIRLNAGSGFGRLSPAVWNSIKSVVASIASRTVPSGGGDLDSAAKDIPEEDKATDEEVNRALHELRRELRGGTMSFEEMRMYLSILNRMIKTNVIAKTVDSSAYYNALRSFIENPARFMSLNKPDGGWSHQMKPVAVALSGEVAPIQKAAELIANAVDGKPEERVVIDALKKTMDEMSDAEIRSIVWADRRLKKGRETAGKILEPYGVDHSDLSTELERRPGLRRRFRLARKQKSEFRKTRPEPLD